MPQYHISASPSQVSQMITQGALLQNLSTTETIYLDTESSVSPSAYGIALGPRSAMSWQADTTLWAVTGPGDGADLSVMYGASNTALGEVSVVGEVNIDGDVTVTGAVDASGSVVTLGAPVTINGPVDVSGSDVSVTGPVTITGTVQVGNVVQTETEITNTVSTSVTGTVDTVVTAPVSIDGPVDVSGSTVGVTGPVTVSGSVDASGSSVNVSGDVNVGSVANTVQIDGTVDIDLPVNVQGGGSRLPISIVSNGTITAGSRVAVPPTGSTPTVVRVDGPTNGLTYYGLYFYMKLIPDPSVVGDVKFPLGYSVVGDDGMVDQVLQRVPQCEGSLIADYTSVGELGSPDTAGFTIPTVSQYPYYVSLYNFSGYDEEVNLGVFGVSAADPYPRTDWSIQTRTGNVFTGAVVLEENKPLLLPGSYIDYSLRVYRPGTSDLTALSTYHVDPDGTYVQQDLQVHANSTEGSAFIVRVPGTGYAGALMSTAALTNNCYVSLRTQV